MTRELKDLPDDFQLDQLRASMAFVPDFSCAIDVGAHRGIWTREMLRHFDKVVAFEPVRELFAQLPQGDRCIRHNAACGALEGYCQIKPGPRNTGQGMVIPGGNIPVMVIDQLGLAPTFIKVDVEGFEFDVLKGARKTIKKHRPVILIEENGLGKHHGHYHDRASALLQSWGMKKRAVFYVPPEPDRNVLFTW